MTATAMYLVERLDEDLAHTLAEQIQVEEAQLAADAEAAFLLSQQELAAQKRRMDMEASAGTLEAFGQEERDRSLALQLEQEAVRQAQLAADAEAAFLLSQQEHTAHRVQRQLDEEASARLLETFRQEELHQAALLAAQLASDIEAAEDLQGEEKGRQVECRFCSAVIAVEADAQQGFHCSSEMCQEKGQRFCDKLLSCGHPCGGVRGEKECTPCVRCTLSHDRCAICLDKFPQNPVIKLVCGHVVHRDCMAESMEQCAVKGQKVFPRLLICPLTCPGVINHPSLPACSHFGNLYRRMVADALHRAIQAKKCTTDSPLEEMVLLGSHPFFICFTCGEPFSNDAICCVEGEPEPEAVLCKSCQVVEQATCQEHGNEQLLYKCYYCCQPASFVCGGASRRFCNACHNLGFNAPAKLCDPANCAVHGKHPANPCDFVVGCALCRGE
eukprot:GGOE01061900.1.p1 GENE.GGOE01061900.1~~GGOE01061900.1.p1  ORF type:complete len:443 (+),score=82.16 GGOE01061900.1:43-1371(+)